MYQSQEILRSVGPDDIYGINNYNNLNNHNNNNLDNNTNRYSVNINYIPTSNSYLNPNISVSVKPGSTIYAN